MMEIYIKVFVKGYKKREIIGEMDVFKTCIVIDSMDSMML